MDCRNTKRKGPGWGPLEFGHSQGGLVSVQATSYHCSALCTGCGDSFVPYQGFPDGLYLLKQPSVRKVGIDHYGIWDIGNRIGIEGADGINPVVVHQVLEGMRPEWFQDTGSWTVLGKITDEPGALHRLEIAFRDPSYRLFDNNCEHFARYIATGVKESTQVQAVGIVAGLAVLAFIASRSE